MVKRFFSRVDNSIPANYCKEIDKQIVCLVSCIVFVPERPAKMTVYRVKWGELCDCLTVVVSPLSIGYNVYKIQREIKHFYSCLNFKVYLKMSQIT